MSNRIRTNYIIVMKDYNVEDIDVTNYIINNIVSNIYQKLLKINVIVN